MYFGYLLLAGLMSVPGLPERSRVLQLMQRGEVAGISAGFGRLGQSAQVKAYGLRNASTQRKITTETVFEAASLTKPVFALAVLRLAAAGKLSLDEPLGTYLPGYAANDPAVERITARQVLSHRSGLPNWRRGSDLTTMKPPGEAFSYSGEGYVYLQKAVEKITGESTDAVVRRLVFEPLDMKRSSLVWRADYDTDYASPHAGLRPASKNRPQEANAAASLHTTAGDYVRFVMEVLAKEKSMFEPQVEMGQRCVECVRNPSPEKMDPGLAWGLGWGLETAERTFFHWGDNGNFKCFVMGSLSDNSALVVFTNSNTGLSIMEDLVSATYPGEHPSFRWLNYERYDGPRSRFLRHALSKGAAHASTGKEAAALTPEDRRSVSAELLNRGHIKDSLWMREKAVAESPNSARAHADLGEVLLFEGRFEEAAKEYRAALALEPSERWRGMLNTLERGWFPLPRPGGRVRFHLKGFSNARTVVVAGTLNQWDTRMLPMRRETDGWEVRVDLPPGRYEYKYVVDGEWIADPAQNSGTKPGDGSANSILKVN